MSHPAEADPNERHDRIADPKAAAVEKDLYARLSAWLRRTQDPALLWKSVTEFVP